MSALNTLNFRKLVSLFVMFVMLANLAQPVFAADARPKDGQMTKGFGWGGALLGAAGGGALGWYLGTAGWAIGATTLIGLAPWVIGGALVVWGVSKLFTGAEKFADDLRSQQDKQRRMYIDEAGPDSSGSGGDTLLGQPMQKP